MDLFHDVKTTVIPTFVQCRQCGKYQRLKDARKNPAAYVEAGHYLKFCNCRTENHRKRKGVIINHI